MIHEFITDSTKVFRQGADVRIENDLIWLDGVPASDEVGRGLALVNMHFIVVGVSTSDLEENKSALIEWCENYPEPERLADGPSYIELGGVFGDQTAALRLMAAGEVLGLWSVITPAKLGFNGPEADMMAGRGMVMISGYRNIRIADNRNYQ